MEKLSVAEKKKRRAEVREKVRKCRERAKAAKADNLTKDKPLIINFNFKQRNAKKRVNRGISKATVRAAKLEKQNELLKHTNKRFQKHLNRLNMALSATPLSLSALSTESETDQPLPDSPDENLTPKRLTMQQISHTGVSPCHVPLVLRKRLLLRNFLVKELGLAVKSNKNGTQVIRNVAAGKNCKKYRCASALGKGIKINRHKITETLDKSIAIKKRWCSDGVSNRLKSDVLSFLGRDDNSRKMPGKNDAKKVETGVKKQKRILNDYLKNLHLKFLSEEPDIRISLASFCRLRPLHIMLVNFTSRNTCLCRKHQNMALKLKAVKSAGVQVSTDPDTFVCLDTPDAVGLLQDIKNEHLTYMVWKKVPVEINGKTKEKMKIVKVKKTKEDFLALMKEEIVEFKDHVERVKNQYNQVKQLKEILPSNHAMVQMDFAEDYKCQSQDEIQSAYWNATQVTLHPTVVYYKEENTLEHKSFVFVSDEPAHNASTVFAILKKLVPEIKKIVPNLDMVHYWTDSPMSQYRNKSIFSIVCNHKNWLDGGGAIWNYFEAGHGKGPCDGIGGTAKRLADDAIKQEKAIIQDAHDFFAWAKKPRVPVSSLIFVFQQMNVKKAKES